MGFAEKTTTITTYLDGAILAVVSYSGYAFYDYASADK